MEDWVGPAVGLEGAVGAHRCAQCERLLERIAVGLLPQALPTSYLEGYERLRETARRRHPSRAVGIVSETGWYASETFKHFAADRGERQTAGDSIAHNV